MLMPLLWAGWSAIQTPLRYLFLIAEVAISLGISLTYSRGGAIGWALSLLFFTAVWASVKMLCEPVSRAAFVLGRVFIFAACMITTGLLRRFADSPHDASVTHRIELWRGGFQLIDASPLLGWGKGNSGIAYVHWFQPLGSIVSPGGMVNSYLHIATEFGVIALGAYLFVQIIPVLLGILPVRGRGPDNRTILTIALASGLVGFSVVSIFSTLWLLPSVIWLPIAECLAILWLMRTSDVKLFYLAATASMMAAIVLVFSVLVTGRFLRGGDSKIARLNAGAVYLGFDGPVRDRPLYIVVDHQCLGAAYGRAIRANETLFRSRFSEIFVVPPGVPFPGRGGPVVMFGHRANEMISLKTTNSVVIVAPTCEPVIPGGTKLLIIPTFDALGWSNLWAKAAKERRLTIKCVQGVGENLSAASREVFQDAIDVL